MTMTLFKRFSSYVHSGHKTIRSIASTPFMQVIVALPPILSICTTVALLWFMRSLPPQVPLYYSRPWGAEQLAPQLFLFLLPLTSFVWYIASLIFINYQTYQYRVFAQILLIMQAVCSTLTTLIVLNILHLMI